MERLEKFAQDVASGSHWKNFQKTRRMEHHKEEDIVGAKNVIVRYVRHAESLQLANNDQGSNVNKSHPVMVGGAVAHLSLHSGQAPAATPEPDVRLSPQRAVCACKNGWPRWVVHCQPAGNGLNASSTSLPTSSASPSATGAS